MKKILFFLALTVTPIFAQVNGKFAKVDATQGYTINGSAPSNQVLCGNGTTAVFTFVCGTVSVPFYQTLQIAGVPLPQRNILNFDSNFTANDTSPSSTIHLAATITSTAANANAVGGVSLAGLCQTGGSGCPTSTAKDYVWTFTSCANGTGQPSRCTGTVTLPGSMPNASYWLHCDVYAASEPSDQMISIHTYPLPTTSGASISYAMVQVMQNGTSGGVALPGTCYAHHN